MNGNITKLVLGIVFSAALDLIFDARKIWFFLFGLKSSRFFEKNQVVVDNKWRYEWWANGQKMRFWNLQLLYWNRYLTLQSVTCSLANLVDREDIWWCHVFMIVFRRFLLSLTFWSSYRVPESWKSIKIQNM